MSDFINESVKAVDDIDEIWHSMFSSIYPQSQEGLARILVGLSQGV